jgi:hypothetical protein
MPRMTTTLCSAAAAGLTALAVTVAGPALGAGSPPGKPVKEADHQNGPTPLALQACLQDHGATGVPGDEREGRALKEWIVAHQDDASVRDALKACDVFFDEAKDGSNGPAPGSKPGCASPAEPKAAPSAAAREKARRVKAARKT